MDISEKALVLAERIKKKSAPGKFYKQMVQNISYFNKNEIFPIRSKQEIDKNTYYWAKNSKIINIYSNDLKDTNSLLL